MKYRKVLVGLLCTHPFSVKTVSRRTRLLPRFNICGPFLWLETGMSKLGSHDDQILKPNVSRVSPDQSHFLPELTRNDACIGGNIAGKPTVAEADRTF